MQEDTQADGRPDGAPLESIQEHKLPSPPQATLKKRAQSYTDFHYAVRAVLGKEQKGVERSKSVSRLSDRNQRSLVEDVVETDLDFADWYNTIEQSLLDSSHDEFTYVLGIRPFARHT